MRVDLNPEWIHTSRSLLGTFDLFVKRGTIEQCTQILASWSSEKWSLRNGSQQIRNPAPDNVGKLMSVPLCFLIGYSNGCAHIYDLFLNEPNDRIKEYTWIDMTEKGISVNTPIHVVNWPGGLNLMKWLNQWNNRTSKLLW